MRLIALAFAAAVSLPLAGCVTTNTTDIAPNVVRLDTDASGALFQGQAGPENMKAAAQATIARGFTCFKFADVQTGQSREFAGMYTTGQATAFGNYGMANVYGSSTSTPMYRRTEQVGATVVMSNTCDADSFNAAQVLAAKK